MFSDQQVEALGTPDSGSADFQEPGIYRVSGFTRGYFDYADGVSSLGVFIKIGFKCVFKIDFRRQTELAPEAPTGLLH